MAESSSSLPLSTEEGYPPGVAYGKMQYLYDAKGVTYLDLVSREVHVGHCHPRVVNAAVKQMSQVLNAQGFLNDWQSQYADQLIKTFAGAFDAAFFTNSRKEAIHVAARISRARTGSNEVFIVGGEKSPLTNIFSPPVRTHLLPFPKSSKESDISTVIEEARAKLRAFKSTGGRIACLLSEPMPLEEGLNELPPSYLNAVYSVVHSDGGLTVLDESLTGLGRTGESLWYFKSAQLPVPDILVMNEGIGNGFPLATVFTSHELGTSLVEYYNSSGGNAVACRTGLAVLEVVLQQNLVSSVDSVSRLLRTGISKLRIEHSTILGDMRGKGFLLALDILPERPVEERAQKARDILLRLRSRRILVSRCGKDKDALLLSPPLCFCIANARLFLEELEGVLVDLKESSDAVTANKHTENSVQTSMAEEKKTTTDSEVSQDGVEAKRRRKDTDVICK